MHITRSAENALDQSDVRAAISCHLRGDWGEGSQQDWDANDASLEQRNRVRGVHRTAAGLLFWIVTDLIRCATMIALPCDYE